MRNVSDWRRYWDVRPRCGPWLRAAMTVVMLLASGLPAVAQTTLPGAPSNLVARVVDDILSVTWDPPATGAPFAAYVLYVGQPGLPGAATIPTAGLSFTTPVTGFVGTLSFAVAAVNAVGIGPESATASITIGPVAVPGAPLNLVANVTNGVLTISWDPPATGGPTAFYRLYASGPGSTGLGSIQVNRTVFSTPWNRAVVGTFAFAVTAVNQAGEGPRSGVVSLTFGPTALPGAPLNLTATVAHDVLTISWDPPSSGTPVTTYLLRAGGQGAPGFGALSVVGTSFSTYVAGAPPVTFAVTVSAVNHLGEGPPTAPVTVTLGPSTLPDPPQNLATSLSGGVLTVSWTPPATGAPITQYLLRATGSSFAGVWTLSTPSTSFAAPAGQLANGNYSFTVSAVNGIGEGSPTAPQTVTIGPPCPVPSAPVLNGSVNGSVVSLSWSTPVVGQVTSYTLRVSTPGSGGAGHQLAADVGLLHALSGPVTAGTYLLQVVAQSACGTGAPSNQVRVDVP